LAQNAFITDSGNLSRCTQPRRTRIKEALQIVHALHAPSPAPHDCSWTHLLTARGWRRGVQHMHDPTGLVDARWGRQGVAGQVATVGDQGMQSKPFQQMM